MDVLANYLPLGQQRFKWSSWGVVTLGILFLNRLYSQELPRSGSSAEITQAAESVEAIQPPSQNCDRLLGDCRGLRSKLADLGIDFQVTYLSEILSTVSGGIKTGTIYEGLLKTQLDFDAEKIVGIQDGQLRVSGLYPHGRSASQNYLGDLFTFSNIDALEGPRLYEVWYDQGFLGKRLSLRIGQLAADQEFAYTDYGSIFVNSAYGWPAPIGLNVSSPAYPVATPGVRLELKLNSNWIIRGGVYNGNPYPFDCSGDALNPDGLYFKIRDALFLGESQWDWHRGDTNRLYPGTLKLGGWFHTGVFGDVYWDDAGHSLAHPSSSGRPNPVRNNWGLYLIAEQEVWRERLDDPEQGLGLFSRISGTPADGNFLDLYLEGGLTYKGLISGRESDSLGVAVAYGRVSGGVRMLARDRNIYGNIHEPLPDYEQALEATYRIAVRPGLAIQPVVGYIAHPGGCPGNDAVVVGVRATVDF